MRLLYSVREPDAALYADELPQAARRGGQRGRRRPHVRLDAGSRRAAPPGRRDGWTQRSSPPPTWPPELEPTCYVCGPTGFVELVADLLVAAGHDTKRIRTERFGPTGGGRR